jgi:hypothetical protein
MAQVAYATERNEGVLTMFSGRKKWSKHPGLIEVYVASGLLQAEIVKGKLETNDIPVLLEYESLGPVMGLTLNGLGQVRVLVREDKAEIARALLEETEANSDDSPVDE